MLLYLLHCFNYYTLISSCLLYWPYCRPQNISQHTCHRLTICIYLEIHQQKSAKLSITEPVSVVPVLFYEYIHQPTTCCCCCFFCVNEVHPKYQDTSQLILHILSIYIIKYIILMYMRKVILRWITLNKRNTNSWSQYIHNTVLWLD